MARRFKKAKKEGKPRTAKGVTAFWALVKDVSQKGPLRFVLNGEYGKEIKFRIENGVIEESYAIRDALLPAMATLRLACDEAETLCPKSYWPFPTYGDLLFGVR